MHTAVRRCALLARPPSRAPVARGDKLATDSALGAAGLWSNGDEQSQGRQRCRGIANAQRCSHGCKRVRSKIRTAQRKARANSINFVDCTQTYECVLFECMLAGRDSTVLAESRVVFERCAKVYSLSSDQTYSKQTILGKGRHRLCAGEKWARCAEIGEGGFARVFSAASLTLPATPATRFYPPDRP